MSISSTMPGCAWSVPARRSRLTVSRWSRLWHGSLPTQASSMSSAAVYVPDSRQGTLTDERGRYVLRLHDGRHRIRTSYVGKEACVKMVQVTGDTTLHFTLGDNATLASVTIDGRRDAALLTTQTGKRVLTADDIRTEFSLLSSPDLVKTLQRISGVAGGIEATSAEKPTSHGCLLSATTFASAPSSSATHSARRP